MENKFNQKRFRELLKKGIGTRTQKEFAEQTGMAQATISRMFNDEVISCPKVKTLEVFAANMPNVSLSELMSACGYKMPTIEDAVKQMESDISDYFAFGSSDERLDIYENAYEITSGLQPFLTKDTRKVNIIRSEMKELPPKMTKKGAENGTKVQALWSYDNYVCCTMFSVFYLETKSGKIILVDTDIDKDAGEKEGYIQHTQVEIKKEVRETMQRFKAFFGGMTDKEGNPVPAFPQTYPGTGFYFTGTPAGFTDFLNAHADTFCDSRENSALYRRVVEGEDPETVFAEYGELYAIHEKGTGAVIADIMRKESGEGFAYFAPEEKLPEEQRNACIMVMEKLDFMEMIPKERLIYISQCAKELQIPEFGQVYYHTICEETRGQVYETDKFFIHQE